jgi:RNA polymerase-binding transcription factor DksA
MKCREIDLPGELRQALEAKRDELIGNHFRLQEFAAERDPELTDRVAELLVRNGFLLNQVLNALDRIASRRYGECLNCGEPVCAKGLVALPWAAFCQPCQKALDSQNADMHPQISHAG